MDAIVKPRSELSEDERLAMLRRLESCRPNDDQVRLAFLGIRSEQLYLDGYSDWPSYCLGKWNVCHKKIDMWIATGVRPPSLSPVSEKPKPAKTSRVYFVCAAELGRVKIGVTDRLASRLSALQTFSPSPLVLLGTVDGDRYEERRIHRIFRADRIHGEWFNLTDSLIGFIKQHCSTTKHFQEVCSVK